ncbi:hypothetical protein RJP21_21785 [Paenibacillus sp. VCA1]|uniref:hypothetical protein n=1 Tax=Paenibacillus sp. VCA1 TaxID=3039148 RepID=UPI0028719F72|nr:hypothetical protein [Paenibacillus sp. VCA1]MDR9856236.1 hypothetical protein [Paenibacillus sp. VCA1]
MNRMTGVMKMLWKDKWNWVYIPWIILLFSFAVNVFIGFLTGGEENFYSGGIISIYAYMFVCSLIIQGQTFLFALGMNVRRMDFFAGTSFMGLLVSAASGIALFLLSIVEKMSDGWGVHLSYFNFPFMNGTSSIGRLGIYFILMVHMFFLGMVISSIYRRFKRTGLFVFFAALFILSSVASLALTYYGLWLDMFGWIADHYLNLFIWLAPIAAVYALLSYAMIRRATV